ncbi:MAG: response regulator [Gammaproteobacteria bacterium]|nr:response regulator [Gammaproteobacteria bacterium]
MSSIGKTYKGNVLFVDDSRVNLMMGSKMLSLFGLNVTTAENGLQAVDLCKEHSFRLIFMDLEMPKLGGLAAAAIIREQKLSYAPIYALTGTGGEEIRLFCRAAHMNGFIIKPLKKDKIQSVLDSIF